MILSRRSFLKVAGLSAVAVAGASMFTGCNVNNLFSTGVVYSAEVGSSITEDTIKKLNESKYTNAVPGHSDLYSNNDGKCKEAVQNQLNGAQVLSNIPGAKNVEVESAKTKMVKRPALMSSRPFWLRRPPLPTADFPTPSHERRAFARLFLFCPACAHPLLHCMAAVIYNKEYCKHHPVFSRKDTLSCEFVFIPLAARST